MTDLEPQDTEHGRLCLTPTPDDGLRLSATSPWDETTRPRRPRSAAGSVYTRRGRLVGRHVIDVHDMFRRELAELRALLAEVRDGQRSAGDAPTALNAMALRRADWTLGAFCARYCGAISRHHALEDDAIFPHLARSEPALVPVIDRLSKEPLFIDDAVQAVDHEPIESAIDASTDALLSHLSYEEHEIVEPLARYGFYPGQVS